MDVNLKVKANLRIRAFYLFFVIGSIQIGVGVMGSPMYVFREARQDSWISIIIAYIFILFVLFVMLRILRQYDNADIFGIQVDLFGKWLGMALGTFYIIYFFVTLLTVLVTYIEVIQIFIFPEISSLVLGVLLLSLVIYSVLGGIRVIIGVVFLFFFLAHWLLLLLYEPARNIELDHFRPVLNASVMELLKGSRETVFTFAGFEILFIIYPFIQNKKQAGRPVYWGTTWAAAIVFINTVISIGYFSPQRMEEMEWSVLSLFKIVKFPFIERFDYIVVAEWMMVTLPNMILLMWVITYGLKRMYKVPQKITLYVSAGILFVLCGFVTYHYWIMNLTDALSNIAFWVVYIYPLILLPLVILKKKLRKRKKGSDQK
ncbi:GerAB/ArcD/ProY family transporter [Virgibacillus dakarensis]|uniref:Germination protein GerB n=1 Tax=Lentibacillus populi TaxID=1827502 RepID=A0A9W5X6Z0_9BACI|nr:MULTISPECIES: GerAB/ArcD/ProY family transporter [Bacillaceae]MTW87008.1 GerAB/ArcD/ProY family transporter [Virgibacillus dakarensis]GGB56045.1 germination protein GerB [Lentibacillus populi]